MLNIRAQAETRWQSGCLSGNTDLFDEYQYALTRRC
jgi:hypothetical protein